MPYMDAMGLFHDQNKTCFCWRGSWLDLVDEFYHVASSLKYPKMAFLTSPAENSRFGSSSSFGRAAKSPGTNKKHLMMVWYG